VTLSRGYGRERKVTAARRQSDGIGEDRPG
jgi:hypothetical protein